MRCKLDLGQVDEGSVDGVRLMTSKVSYNSWSGLPGLWALGSGLLGSGLPGLWAPEFTGLQRLLGSLGSQTGICSQSLKCFLHCANFSSSEYVPKM